MEAPLYQRFVGTMEPAEPMLNISLYCIICTVLVIRYLKGFFNVSENLAQLIAVGTSICGASAIIAFSSTIPAKKNEVVLQ